MRTPLAWTLSVTISPLNSLPLFLKVPMVAMLSLLGCYFEHRAHRGLDGDQGAGGDRRRTLQGRSAAEDVGRETFLSREEARRAGEDSRTTGVEAEATEAKPAFGQHSTFRDRVGVCMCRH